MKPIDWIIIGAVVFLLIGITAHLYKRKKAGKGGCGCACRGCPSAGSCSATKKETPAVTEEENV